MTLVLNVLMCGYLKFNEEGIHQADYLYLIVLIHTISSSLYYEYVQYVALIIICCLNVI